VRTGLAQAISRACDRQPQQLVADAARDGHRGHAFGTVAVDPGIAERADSFQHPLEVRRVGNGLRRQGPAMARLSAVITEPRLSPLVAEGAELSREAVCELVLRGSEPIAGSRVSNANLTARQVEVLRLVVHGKTAEEFGSCSGSARGDRRDACGQRGRLSGMLQQDRSGSNRDGARPAVLNAWQVGTCGLVEGNSRAAAGLCSLRAARRCEFTAARGCTPIHRRSAAGAGTNSNAITIASTLRAYLRYRATCGDVVQPLLAVIASPAPGAWRRCPEASKPEEVDRLLNSFTDALPSPRRGYAVVRLALDLGRDEGRVA
jgi:hypothetical protein